MTMLIPDLRRWRFGDEAEWKRSLKLMLEERQMLEGVGLNDASKMRNWGRGEELYEPPT